MSRIILAIALLVATITTANAQKLQKNTSAKNQYSIVFGLTQPLILKGFNVEVNYWRKKMVFDYSHGFNLHVAGKQVSKEIESQKINFKISHSLGFGIGYRFTKAFNVRFEPKMHIYETYYDAQIQNNTNSLVRFTTYTLGLGTYYRWTPFEKKENILKGITVVPSIRYWKKVSSTLNNNKFDYYNTQTKSNQSFKAPNIGMNNTPIFVNVSIGYTF